MTPQSVASAPKEIAPQRAAPHLPAIATAAAFDQLLSLGLGAPTNLSKPANQPDAAPPAARPKAKTGDDPTNGASAAAILPTPTPQLLPAISVATTSGEIQVAAPSVPLPYAVKPPEIAAATTADAAATEAGTNAGLTKAPPGAAALEARIVAAAPNYLSQPNAALAGLWHHLGAGTQAPAPGQPGAPPQGAAAPTSGDAATASTDATATDAATLAKDLPLEAHAAPAIDAAQATTGGPDKPAASGGVTDPTAAATIALPGAADAPLAAAQAAPANPALPAPAQIPPAWEQVAVNLGQAAQTNTDRIEIQLKPASLGAIAVKLDLTHDGRVSAVISADRSDTLNLLRQHSDALTQSLRDAGLQADSGSLSFNLRGDAQSFAQAPAPTAAAPRHDDPVTSLPATIDTTRYRQHAGAVDIEV